MSGNQVKLKPQIRVAGNYCVPCQQCCSLKLIICSCLNKLFAYHMSSISLLNTYNYALLLLRHVNNKIKSKDDRRL